MVKMKSFSIATRLLGVGGCWIIVAVIEGLVGVVEVGVGVAGFAEIGEFVGCSEEGVVRCFFVGCATVLLLFCGIVGDCFGDALLLYVWGDPLCCC